MREDPIIYEDWEIGFSKGTELSFLVIFEFILSCIISLNFIIWSYALGSGFRIFLWIFALPVLFYVEIISNQYQRTTYERLMVILGIFLLTFITLNINNEIHLIFNYIGMISLLLKIGMMPLSMSAMSFEGEILIPRDQNVNMVLNEHIIRLENTEFKVDGADEFKKSIITIQKSILFLIIPSVIISLAFVFFSLLFDFVVIKVLGSAIVFTTGISFLGVTAIWYIFKRYKDEPKEEKLEIIPVFANST